jgi:hypothetical protein
MKCKSFLLRNLLAVVKGIGKVEGEDAGTEGREE